MNYELDDSIERLIPHCVNGVQCATIDVYHDYINTINTTTIPPEKQSPLNKSNDVNISETVTIIKENKNRKELRQDTAKIYLYNEYPTRKQCNNDDQQSRLDCCCENREISPTLLSSATSATLTMPDSDDHSFSTILSSSFSSTSSTCDMCCRVITLEDGLLYKASGHHNSEDPQHQKRQLICNKLTSNIIVRAITLLMLWMCCHHWRVSNRTTERLYNIQNDNNPPTINIANRKSRKTAVNRLEYFMMFASLIRLRTQHRNHSRHITTKLQQINIKLRNTMKLLSKELLLQNFKSTHIVLTMIFLLLAQETCKTDALLANLATGTNISNEDLGQTIQKTHNRTDANTFTDNHHDQNNVTNYKDNFINNNNKNNHNSNTNNNSSKRSNHPILGLGDNSQLKHSPSVRVGTDVVVPDNEGAENTNNNNNNNNAYLDRMDNLERSLEAVLIKVAYGTTSTTKRSIPDNSQVPSLTTIVTPLLTTLRHQNMKSPQQHPLDTHHRNYELDLERDHALPTSAPNADILKSNSNPTYPNPNRHHNYDREKYRNSTPIPPSLPNILKKTNEQLATIPMFAGNAPSHMPPLRSFFTPPLPKEYQHPFADKPTLRGTNSDGVILPNTGTFTNRRPIPPPSLMPGHERIPFRPPDLTVGNMNGAHDNANGGGGLSSLSASSLGSGATTTSPTNVQGPVINNGGLYERKKVLNTPSKGNDLLGHDNESKQNENPSSETTVNINGVNGNPVENNNPNIRKEVLPIIRRILSGSNGRKDDIHEVLLKHVTTRRPINGQQQSSSSSPSLYNNNSGDNSNDQRQRITSADHGDNGDTDTNEGHKTKLSTNTGSEYVSIGLNAISPTSSSSSSSSSSASTSSLSSSSSVAGIPDSSGTMNGETIAHDAAASSASSFATSPSLTHKNLNGKNIIGNNSNTRLNSVSSSSSTLSASTAHSTWNVAWNIHVYLSVILFTMLTVYSLYKMVTYNKLTHLFTQSYFICIHGVLIIICSTRVFYLCYDAYNIHGTFQIFMSEILLNLPSLLLTVCFSVLILFLSLKSLNRKNSRYSALIRPITVIIGCGVHILLCITLHYVESYTMHNQQQQQHQLWRRQHIQMQMQLQQQQQQQQLQLQQQQHYQQQQQLYQAQQAYFHNQPEYRTFQYTSMNEQPKQYLNDHNKLMGIAALAATPLALTQFQQLTNGIITDDLLGNGNNSNSATMSAAAAAAAAAAGATVASSPPRVLSLICQIIYTFVCFSLGLLYLYLYRILKRILRSKSQNYIHCYQNLSYAIHITIATALLFVLLAALHVFGAISISTMRPLMAQITTDIDWLQWGYQFSLRLIEIAIITLISWVSGLKTGGGNGGGSNGSVTVGVGSGGSSTGGPGAGGVHMTLTNGDIRIVPYRATNMFDSTRSVGTGTGISGHMQKSIGYSHEKHRPHLHAPHPNNMGNGNTNNGGGNGNGVGSGGGFFLTCTSSSSKENIETDYPSVYNANANLHTYTMRTGKLIYDDSYSLNTMGNGNNGSGIPLSATDVQIGNSNYPHHYQTTPQPSYQHPYDNDSTHSSVHCQPHRGHHHRHYVDDCGTRYGNDDPSSLYCDDDYGSDNAGDHYENPNFDLRGSGSAASATSANSTSGALTHNPNTINTSDVQKFSKSSTISTTTALSSNNSNDSNSVAASATSAISAASVASQQQVLLIPDNNSYSEPLQLQQSGYEFHNFEKPNFSGHHPTHHHHHHNDNDNWSQQQRQILYNGTHERSNHCSAHNQLEFCSYNPVEQRHSSTNGSQHSSCYVMGSGGTTMDGHGKHSIYNSSDRKIHNSVRLKKHDNFMNTNAVSNNSNSIHVGGGGNATISSPSASASSTGSSPSSASSSTPSTASSSNSTRGGLCTTQTETAGACGGVGADRYHQQQPQAHNYHSKKMPIKNQQLTNAFGHSARLDNLNSSQLNHKSRSQTSNIHTRSQSPSAYSDDDENESDMMLTDSNTTPQPSSLIHP